MLEFKPRQYFHRDRQSTQDDYNLAAIGMVLREVRLPRYLVPYVVSFHLD